MTAVAVMAGNELRAALQLPPTDGSEMVPLPQPCALHKTHSPKNLTVEFHHIVVVSWQLHTASLVPAPPFPGLDPDGRGMLWDTRGTWLCPTAHRNVHFWIVRCMRELAARKREDSATLAALRSLVGLKRAPAEFPVAIEALTRFMAEVPGGSLLALSAAGEWGQV